MTIPWNPFTEAIFNTLVTLAGLILLALGGLLLAYLQQQTARIRDQRLRSAVEGAATEAVRVAYEAALYAEQTFASSVREKATDGKLSPDEQRQAMETALQYFVRHISEQSVRVLKPAQQSLENWARELIETQVPQAKALVGASASAAGATRGNPPGQG